MGIKRKIRMYEPWGYKEENNYQSDEIIFINDLDSFFSEASYNKDDKKIHFFNKDNEEKAAIDVTEFSASVVESAVYDKDTKILTITFANGDVVNINLAELIDENEFADGLQVNDGVVSVLIDSLSEGYISASETGIKISGVDAAIEAEKNRAEGEEERIEGKLDSEIARATSAEAVLHEEIETESRRAESAETTLTNSLNIEIARAISKEERIEAKLDNEIADRVSDVNEEETRAKAAEATINSTIGNGFSTASTETITAKFNKLTSDLNTEIGNRTTQDNQLQNVINTESTARQGGDTRIENLLTDEANRAKGVEESLSQKIDEETINRKADVNAEEARAISAETEINNTAIFGADYIEGSKTIAFYNKNGQLVDTIDATPFVKDGMIESVYIDHETNELVIIWNTESGKQETRIALSEIFNPDDYYTKTEVDTFLVKKVDKELIGTNGKALIFNETDGGGAKFEHTDGTWSFVGVNDGGENGITSQIYALKKNAENKMEGARIDVSKNGMYYTVGADSADLRDVAENEIATKGNVDAAVKVEELRAKAAEEALDNKIDEITSGGTIQKLDDLIEKLGYQNNDTLVTTNEHEVAFGEWNISNTDVEPSGQTVFSVGIGTSAHDRKNAIEIMKDGSVFMWVEGEFMNINKLLGQISHEVYDTNP